MNGKTSGYAPVNGLDMYYELRGAGPPAVYIHPNVSHGGLAPALTGNRRWLAMDLQGHGRTADRASAMTCDQHADDIAAMMRHLGIDHADFFGDSFGGAIAVTMALRHPALVRRVAAYGSSLAPFPKEVETLVTPDLVPWEAAEYRKVAPHPQHWPITFTKAVRSGIDWPGISSDHLRALTVPVLIACGDHDLCSIDRCVELARLIPQGQLAIIPDASHFVLFSEPEKLLPVIAAFFNAPTPTLPLSTFASGFRPGVTR